MKNMYTRGIATSAVIAIIAVILLGGAMWYANTTSNEDMLEQKAEDMIEEGDKIMKEGEEMVEDGEKMMEEGEEMMEGDKEAMKDDTDVLETTSL